MDTTIAKQTELDPVTLEVIRNALPAISNEMSKDLQRTSYNMMIYAVKDYCTALLNLDGGLVSQNVGGVSHFVADLGVLIVDGMKKYGKNGFKPGDVLITNHQAVAGQHLNNIVIYTPIFFEGELVMFAMVRAHWIDVGGLSTGFGAGPSVADAWLEGLQLNQLKMYEGGKLNEILHTVLHDNIRYPESSLGDMRAQIAACRIAEHRMEELFGKYGLATVRAGIDRLFEESETKCRNIVSKFPDGVYEAEKWLDDDGVVKGEPIRLHAKVTIDHGHMTIDLSGCAGERKAAINSRSLAPARIAYKALTFPVDPVNEGSFRALDVIVPEGNIMMARFPAPMASWSLILPMVTDTIIAALSQAIPDLTPAGHFGLMGANGTFFGMNPKTKRRFVVSASSGGGWGGRPFEDGESGSVNVCQGDVQFASIEEMEMHNPILVETRGLRQDSAGAGKFRGGLGSTTALLTFAAGQWNLGRPGRQNCPPWGLHGGLAGETGEKLLKKPDDTNFHDIQTPRYPTPSGTRVVIESGSGGGWGDPLARDPERVRSDVMEGYVSLEAARRDYGVVFGADNAIDSHATEALRRERALA